MNAAEAIDTATAFLHRRAAIYDFAKAFAEAIEMAPFTLQTSKARAAARRYEYAARRAARIAAQFGTMAENKDMAEVARISEKYAKAQRAEDNALAALLTRAAKCIKEEIAAAKDKPEEAANMAFACLVIHTTQDFINSTKNH